MSNLRQSSAYREFVYHKYIGTLHACQMLLMKLSTVLAEAQERLDRAQSELRVESGILRIQTDQLENVEDRKSAAFDIQQQEVIVSALEKQVQRYTNYLTHERKVAERCWLDMQRRLAKSLAALRHAVG